jgi:hypothetical protein
LRNGTFIITILFISIFVNCELEPDGKTAIQYEEVKAMANDFTVSPIVEYDGYFLQHGKVLGINSSMASREDFEEVKATLTVDDAEGTQTEVVPADFSVQEGTVYFTVQMAFPGEADSDMITVKKYCKQAGGVLTTVTETKFKMPPELSRFVGTVADVEIMESEYNGDTISMARRDYDEPMVFIDGAIAVDGGVLLSIQEGRGPSRPEGLLFWKDGERRMTKWKEKGRLF